MTKPIMDTGAFVGLLSPNDEHHEWAKTVFKSIKPPFHTTEAVITEVCFLLPNSQAVRAFLAKIGSGVIKIDFNLHEQITSILSLMETYGDRGIDLADASVIRLSELHNDCHVFTTDREDFTVYRRNGRQVIPFTAPRRL